MLAGAVTDPTTGMTFAYMQAMNDQYNRLLDKVNTMRPMLLIRKDRRISIVPSGSDEASKPSVQSCAAKRQHLNSGA